MSEEASPITNFLKVREDTAPFEFLLEDMTIQAQGGVSVPSWVSTEPASGYKSLGARIEPWLSALLQSDHLNLLVGSGLTTGLGYIAGSGKQSGMTDGRFTILNEEIDAEATKSAVRAGRDKANIEDRIRVVSQLLRGLEILKDSRAEGLRRELHQVMKEFTDSILRDERNLASAPKREEAFDLLVTFLMSFAARTGSRDRLSIFTTNYDRLLELGAEVAGIHLLDRFVGSISPIFRASRVDLDLHYNPPGIRSEPRYVEGVVRYTKLHGSLDWINNGNLIRRFGLPFGAESTRPYLEAPGLDGASVGDLMIYPNPAKDRETAEYPYVELFRDFAAAVARPNSVIVTFGYSFGDDHINRVIRDALTIPSTHLVIMSFDDPLGRIMRVYEEWGRQHQMSLLIGPDLGNIDSLVKYYLPKPSTELPSHRMADLLRQRIGTDAPAQDMASEFHGRAGGVIQ